MIKLTQEEFIEKANKKHNNFYIYDKVKYITAHSEIIINCPIHGNFKQIAYSHLNGRGCKPCSVKKRTKSQETFIEEANIVHKNYYSYDKIKYINSYSEIIITCPKHGDFKQTPRRHLEGYICWNCFKEKTKKTTKTQRTFIKQKKPKKTMTQEEFISKANIVHKNYYSYENTKCIGSSYKVIITCPIHKDFEQTPYIHLKGSGCAKCRKSPLSKDVVDKPGTLYLLLLKNSKEKFIKLGITNDIVTRKKKFMRYYSVTEIELCNGIYKKLYEYEQKLKNKFHSNSYTPKITFKGYTECFNVEALSEIKSEILKLFSN